MTAELFEVELGGGYQVDAQNRAMWTPAGNGRFDLQVAGRHFDLTLENTGPQGRPRFYVRSVRKPNGRLLQGRRIPDLARKIVEYGDRLVSVETLAKNTATEVQQLKDQVADLQRRLDESRSIKARAGGGGRLRETPVPVTWEQRRYVPKNQPGEFARVPLRMIAASQDFAAGEYRALQAILILSKGTGLLTAGKHKLAEMGRTDSSNVKHFLRSLTNRGILRPTGKLLKWGAKEYELLTNPYFEPANADGSPVATGVAGTSAGGNEGGRTGVTLTPNKTSKERSREDESPRARAREAIAATPREVGTVTRALSRGEDSQKLSDEEELLGRLAEFVGLKETSYEPPHGNRGLWITYIRENPVAMREALGEAKLKRDSGKKPKSCWAALITSDFRRIRDERHR